METLGYTVDEKAEFRTIAAKALVGYLGIMTPDGYPRVVPMNFAADDAFVYIHGERHGETYESLKTSPRVTFSMDLQYSLIPSYWTSQINACAATMLYKSALVKGVGHPVETLEEGIRGLQLIADKYQPEGGYTKMRPDEKTYRGLFKSTAVYKIIPDAISVRINFRQKKSRKYNLMLVENLERRGRGVDLETAAEIRKMLGETTP